MSKRLIQAASVLILAACNAGNSSSAQRNGDRPFEMSAVAQFDSPWAMAFLPDNGTAIVTEKPGRIWLVDLRSGRKRPVEGAPRVVNRGQSGLLDVVLSPDFKHGGIIYLTYAEPSSNGGSGLALARARLFQGVSGARLDGLQVLWRDPAGGEGGSSVPSSSSRLTAGRYS